MGSQLLRAPAAMAMPRAMVALAWLCVVWSRRAATVLRARWVWLGAATAEWSQIAGEAARPRRRCTSVLASQPPGCCARNHLHEWGCSTSTPPTTATNAMYPRWQHGARLRPTSLPCAPSCVARGWCRAIAVFLVWLTPRPTAGVGYRRNPWYEEIRCANPFRRRCVLMRKHFPSPFSILAWPAAGVGLSPVFWCG